MSDPKLSPRDLELATRLHRSAMRLTRQLRAARSSRAMSPSKLLVLGLLQQDGVLTAADLSASLHVQPQSLTRLLAELEGDGLILRQPDPKDRRRGLIRLTPAGTEALAADMLERRRRLAEATLQVLTPAEREVLRVAAGLIDRVATAILPETPSGRAVPHADDALD